MLKTRIIPTLLWKDFGLVKGSGFDNWRRVGPILPAVKVYNLRQVDELIIVDIAASREGRAPDYEEIKNFSKECFVPLTIGGGIKNVEEVRRVLEAGADKVSLNSVIFHNPKLISQVAEIFGSQCVIVSIDAKRKKGQYECFSHSGSQATGVRPDQLAREAEALGAGEILITSIDQDGTMSGYDLELINKISSMVTIPVIASGGAGSFQDMFMAIEKGASAVAAASIFHFTEQTPLGAKDYLRLRGIQTRR